MEAVHIVGAGGIGCAVGYALARSGLRVTFVENNADKIRWGREHGVAVDGLPPVPVDFTWFADWQPPAGMTVLVCTKCYDNAEVLSRLAASTPIIPVQNGFDPALEARTQVEGIASFISECWPQRSHTRITRAGRLHLGPCGPGVDNPDLAGLLRELGERLSQGPFRVEVVPNIRPFKYTKLMYNAAISPLAASAGLDNGQLLRIPHVRRLFFELLRENHAILTNAGIPLGKIGPMHPTTVMAILSRPLVANALAWAFYPTLRRTYCSMAGDLPSGRTEIDYYNGHLLSLAGSTPCPLNRAVHQLIQRMERDRLAPQVSVLDDLGQPNSRQSGTVQATT
jgi:2-dehydropantoate 2-reductase